MGNTTQATPAPHPRTALARGRDVAAAQWERERAALVQCARALAYTYGGAPRPQPAKREQLAQWEAMRNAYDVLGVLDTRDLPGPEPASQTDPASGLTDAEHQAMDITAELWALLCASIVGTEHTAEQDLREIAAKVHDLQNAILAQAAARAHPDRYRLLGRSLRGRTADQAAMYRAVGDANPYAGTSQDPAVIADDLAAEAATFRAAALGDAAKHPEPARG